ncbi:MAG: GHMP kinase [Bacteroidetes bacterium]|nr:GHMP kinase [Rhodothermia bacterium]MCS7154457.1 GHMP kinase [Bacteroidota bacterium]MCX7906830.1 GHMP kinase [Bacteroidota bacterium]MDW8136891.1 GHMP kinase [Bacteroidota bacterium]MDW8285239.1 GHMP kinase [Bacteroidota bacterium]
MSPGIQAKIDRGLRMLQRAQGGVEGREITATDRIIRARAPLRISFGGGGTDVSPYADERGGLVLNATINRYAYVTIVPQETGRITLRSLDYDQVVSYTVEQGPPPFNYEMDLAKGVIRRLGLDQLRLSFDLYTHTDCPPGSGLGASSTMVVALIGAFDTWLQLGLDRYEIAQLAYEIERKDLDIKGGKQDQYAAAFGGFNFMEFYGELVLVNPLRLPPEWVNELEYSLVLAYTGKSRYSAQIIESQIENYRHGDPEAVEAMDRTKQYALELKRALLMGQFREFGCLLHEAWMEKKRMSKQISNPYIDQLYEAAREAGALGGKISGAGGGGFMFFFTEFHRRHDVIRALEYHGAQVVHFGFTDAGVQTWTRQG